MNNPSDNPWVQGAAEIQALLNQQTALDQQQMINLGLTPNQAQMIDRNTFQSTPEEREQKINEILMYNAALAMNPDGSGYSLEQLLSLNLNEQQANVVLAFPGRLQTQALTNLLNPNSGWAEIVNEMSEIPEAATGFGGYYSAGSNMYSRNF